MKTLCQSLGSSVLLLLALHCAGAQSITSTASALETGITAHLQQCTVTNLTVRSRKAQTGAVMFHLDCNGQWVWLTVIQYESAEQARLFLGNELRKVDSSRYQTIPSSNLGDESYTFETWDRSKPELGTLVFRLGNVYYGVTARSDETARAIDQSVSTFMRATQQLVGPERRERVSHHDWSGNT